MIKKNIHALSGAEAESATPARLINLQPEEFSGSLQAGDIVFLLLSTEEMMAEKDMMILAVMI
jgi:hypothetical protein